MNDVSLLIGQGVFGPICWFSKKNQFYLPISAICAPLTKTSPSYRGPVTFHRTLKWSTKATLYKYYSCPVFWPCFEHFLFLLLFTATLRVLRHVVGMSTHAFCMAQFSSNAYDVYATPQLL